MAASLLCLSLFVVASRTCLPLSQCYNQTVRIDNAGAVSLPSVVYWPDTIQDVAKTISLARHNNLQFTVRSGGHSAAGYCLNQGGAVLDIRNLNWNFIDGERHTLIIGAGLTWSQVYAILEKYDPTGATVFPGGFCAGVSPGGYLQGGGVSIISRAFGLGSDNVLNITLVTADGSVRTVGRHSDAQQDVDLFWALQGGGGGNFGVVVQYTLRLRQLKLGPILHTGRICWSVADWISRVAQLFNSVALQEVYNLALYGGLWHQADADVHFCFDYIYHGGTRGDLDTLLGPFFAPGVPAPVSQRGTNGTYYQFEAANGGHTEFTGRGAHIISGITGAQGFPPAMAAQVWQQLNSSKPACSSWLSVWPQLGGRISTVQGNATAYPWRRGTFAFEVKALWDLSDAACRRQTIQWATQMRAKLAPYFVGSYVNYIDPTLDNWPTEYYGDNLARLRQIKKMG